MLRTHARIMSTIRSAAYTTRNRRAFSTHTVISDLNSQLESEFFSAARCLLSLECTFFKFFVTFLFSRVRGGSLEIQNFENSKSLFKNENLPLPRIWKSLVGRAMSLCSSPFEGASCLVGASFWCASAVVVFSTKTEKEKKHQDSLMAVRVSGICTSIHQNSSKSRYETAET